MALKDWKKTSIQIGEKYAWSNQNKRLVVEEMGNGDFFIELKELHSSMVAGGIPISGEQITLLAKFKSKQGVLLWIKQYMRTH